MKTIKYYVINLQSYRGLDYQSTNVVYFSDNLEVLKKVLELKIKADAKNRHINIIENTEDSFVYTWDGWRYNYWIDSV